jgi:hypothetical protein
MFVQLVVGSAVAALVAAALSRLLPAPRYVLSPEELFALEGRLEEVMAYARGAHAAWAADRLLAGTGRLSPRSLEWQYAAELMEKEFVFTAGLDAEDAAAEARRRCAFARAEAVTPMPQGDPADVPVAEEPFLGEAW